MLNRAEMFCVGWLVLVLTNLHEWFTQGNIDLGGIIACFLISVSILIDDA